MGRLLDRIKERVTRDVVQAKPSRATTLPKPATPAEFAAAESQLGFGLPRPLQDLYAGVANGGFGPGTGFLGVPRKGVTGRNLLTAYRGCAGRPGFSWPAHLLPVIYDGCDVYFCLDCDDMAGRVVVFDGDLGGLDWSDLGGSLDEWPYPNHPHPACFRMRARSLDEFLEMWLADEDSLYQW